MSYWSTQYKHAEIARLQNKREERLLQLELESKHGVRNAHRYNIQAVEHEQRLIERELERIRKGMIKKPLQPTAQGYLGNLALFTKSHVPTRRQSRHENAVVNTKYAKENLYQAELDNNLFSAIVPVENERPAPYETSDTILGHLVKSPRDSVLQSGETYPSAAVSQGEYHTGDYTSKERSLRSHDIDSVSKGWPNHTDTQSVTVLGAGELERSGQSIDRNGADRDSRRKQNGIVESETPRIKRRPLRTSLDIAQLASLDMKSVKSDVSRRLSQDHKNVPKNTKEIKQTDNSDAVPVQDVTEVKPKEKSRRISRSKVPAADSHKIVMEFDREHLNPDGSPRKMYNMPSDEKRWDEARKCRYIRGSEPPVGSKELTLEEIFDKSPPDTQCKQ